MKKIKPDAVILAAAKVGGIQANNTFRGEFIYDNLSIQNNIIHGSYINGVKNLIAASCVYIGCEYFIDGKIKSYNLFFKTESSES